MGLVELQAELEKWKAERAAAALRALMAAREIEERVGEERSKAFRAVANAALAAVCENPRGATAYDVLLRACRDCDDAQRYFRAVILSERIAGRKPPRRGARSKHGEVAPDDDGPDPILTLTADQDAERYMPE